MRPNLSLDDMFKELLPLSHERRMAIAFAVYSGLTLDQTINLKWSDDIGSVSWRALFILNKIPVSDCIDNVFWESFQGKDMKMISLPFTFGVVTLWENWGIFSNKYCYSLPIEFNRQISMY